MVHRASQPDGDSVRSLMSAATLMNRKLHCDIITPIHISYAGRDLCTTAPTCREDRTNTVAVWKVLKSILQTEQIAMNG